jgi:acyl carrier protein
MKSEIRDFLALNAGLPKDKLSDDIDLFANEVWDSLLIVRFVTFAEVAFKVRVNLVTLSEEKIRTIANAAEFLNEIKK